MVGMCVEIVTSRAISLQIVRHRSFSYQQFSQRYASSVKMEPVELRSQAEKNRQSSTKHMLTIEPYELVESGSGKYDIEYILRRMMENITSSNFKLDSLLEKKLALDQYLYRYLIDEGVAKECARMFLPSTTQTKLYMNGTVRSWIHYLELRDDEHAQLEHQLIAKEIKHIFIQNFPVISEALGWDEYDT
jgi:thymidylate synthase (FAD)